MLDMYTSIVIITILLLTITVSDILNNRLITRESKRLGVIACVLIGGASLGECIGVLTNGAAPSLILIHRLAKLTEFCCAPAVGVVVARAYGSDIKPKAAMVIVYVHSAFECIAACFGWVFTVDGNNIYQREKLYFVYVAAFIASTAYGFISIIRREREYQCRGDSTVALTLLLLAAGIGIQFVMSDIRVDFLCTAIAHFMLYYRHCNVTMQVDAVTRLLNRRCYETNLSSVDSKAVILFFDVNKFKQVNDKFGHSVGDICLRNVADRLQHVYGKYGLCYRIGGDEFCVILNKNLDMLDKLNEQFCEDIRKMREKDERMPGVSLGYAYYDKSVSHIQSVIEQADEMMYKNKAAADANP
ncbi:MAG: GGDEF domain-containing protein [Oscillospiraceae bacterium]